MTADFNERWTQKIFKNNLVSIEVDYNQGGAEGQAYLNFFILTKKGEYLSPQQRSKGLIWFLSFYLQLTAESKATEELIILFDEPGLYLHSKAQADIKSLFEELAQKDQIIYSTHSPYLIDTEKLNRLRLVINSKETGTTIEKITTKKVRDQKDARKPIIDAIGLEVAHDFSCADKKNIILEGLSDYYYFTGMRKILCVKDNYSFLPSMGASNVHLLLELCLGWGLDWLIILDGGRQAYNEFKKIKKAFFEGDEKKANSKIHRIVKYEGIEDLFTLSDLRLVESNVENPEKLNHSKLITYYGGKELFGRIFSEKVNNGEINKNNLSKSSIKRFKSLFEFIEQGFSS